MESPLRCADGTPIPRKRVAAIPSGAVLHFLEDRLGQTTGLGWICGGFGTSGSRRAIRDYWYVVLGIAPKQLRVP